MKIKSLDRNFRYNRGLLHGTNGKNFEAILTLIKEQQNKINELIEVVNKQQEIISQSTPLNNK